MASRFLTGGEYDRSVVPRSENHRPDVRIWAVGRLTVVEFINVHVLFREDALNELGERLQGLVADGHSQVVLDLSTVRYASSDAVAGHRGSAVSGDKRGRRFRKVIRA